MDGGSLTGPIGESAPNRNFGSLLRRIFLSMARQAISLLAATQTTLIRALVQVPTRPSRDGVQRILIIKLDELGDLVMAWPLVHALKWNLPNAELTLLVNRSVLGITEGMVGIRVIGVDVSGNRALRQFILPFRHYRFVRRHLRGQQFDVCFLPRRDSDDVGATILAYFTSANRRISFTEKSTCRKALTNRSYDSLLTDVVPAPPVQHETTTNLNLMATLGLSPNAPMQRFPITEAADRFAERSLPFSGAPYVALCPSSGHSKLKQWGAERFAAVAAQLASSGIPVVLIGAPQDSQLGALIQSASGGKCLDFIGKTSLSQMAGLLAKCHAFVGNDAGPMHVASALGVPTIGIFGSSCSHQFGPWAPWRSIIAREIHCSPCHSHEKNRCDVCVYIEPVCLHQINPSSVLAAVQDAIASCAPS